MSVLLMFDKNSVSNYYRIAKMFPLWMVMSTLLHGLVNQKLNSQVASWVGSGLAQISQSS